MRVLWKISKISFFLVSGKRHSVFSVTDSEFALVQVPQPESQLLLLDPTCGQRRRGRSCTPLTLTVMLTFLHCGINNKVTSKDMISLNFSNPV